MTEYSSGEENSGPCRHTLMEERCQFLLVFFFSSMFNKSTEITLERRSGCKSRLMLVGLHL